MPLSSIKLQSSVSIEEIKARVRFDSETGKLHRVTASGGSKVGQETGSMSSSGYLGVGICGKAFLCHRIAWLLHYGEWPEFEVDHINGMKTDNRISNLRSATRSENVNNTNLRSDSTSGYKGVNYSNQHGRYRARIVVKGKRMHVGMYDTPEQAHEALCAARNAYHGKFCNNGSSTLK